MATSGTVGQTVVPTARLIESALRKAGITSTQQTPDIFRAAFDCLYDFCISLSNGGVNLWCIERITQGTRNAQYQYTLPDGTLDVMQGIYRQSTLPQGGTPISSGGGIVANAFDQNLSTFCVQNSANGYIEYDFGPNNTPIVDNVGINSYGNHTYSLIYEYSYDGITWATLFQPPNQVSYVDYQWQYYDISQTVQARYYRVRETGGAKLSVREVCFNVTFFEYILGRYNFDDYTSLSQKYQSERQITNFWLDRQIGNNSNPIAWIWPVSNYDFDQLVFWRQRHIQDIGTLSQEVEVPIRWIAALRSGLAERLFLEVPGVDMTRYPIIQAQAEKDYQLADMEEIDDAHGSYIPDTSVYTAI
jgi:hypothetical protein